VAKDPQGYLQEKEYKRTGIKTGSRAVSKELFETAFSGADFIASS
jgi:hypothetical protein